jgi:hypothetical protein
MQSADDTLAGRAGGEIGLSATSAGANKSASVDGGALTARSGAETVTEVGTAGEGCKDTGTI